MKNSRLENSRQSSVVGRQLGAASPLLAAFIAGLAALSLVGCSKEPAEKEPVVPVQVATVEKTPLQRTVVAQAILYPLQQSAITPKISAPVEKYYVQRASHVKAGQLLAVLENRDLSAAAEQNRGDYEQAQAAYETTTAASLPADIQKAQLDVDAAKRMFEAEQKLYDSRQELFKEGALPRKDLDQTGVDFTNAKNQYEIAQKHLDAMMAVEKQQTLKSAAGQLTSAKGKYQGAAAQLGYSEIHSPINGVIADRPLYPGEMAAVGTPLLTVMDISQVIARAHIPQPEAAALKVGDKATISAPGDETPVEGKVTIISPALDPNSTTVEVWVQAKNPKEHLKPGTSVQLAMVAQTIPDALVIPSVALLTGDDGATTVMMVGSDEAAHQTPVKVGMRQGDQVQITDGLKAGDRVVASGAYGLPDKTKIKIETADKAGDDKTNAKPDAGKGGDDDKK
jgi:multidrug efflux pump subunit AcrA (membrane-fusion protein)